MKTRVQRNTISRADCVCVPLKHSVARRLKGRIKRSKVQVHPKVPLKVYRMCLFCMPVVVSVLFQSWMILLN